MMENNCVPSPLVGTEIHGFRTLNDLDVGTMMEEARARWLRPNEIHAILCNHQYFTVNVKPMNLPTSGRVVLFDRKMLRNFRKDGHNWKKKKDGKTVKEAHEHLKVGNDERIHVYYAHGEDNPTFVRRCYWLLDKSREHIVLVHYRETKESQGSPGTSGNSNSNSGLSEPSVTWPLSEESDSALDRPYFGGSRSLLERRDSTVIKNYEQRLHEINTLEWDELLVLDDSQKLSTQLEGKTEGFEIPHHQMNGYRLCSGGSPNKLYPDSSADDFSEQIGSNNINYDISNHVSYERLEHETIANSQTENSGVGAVGAVDTSHNVGEDRLHAQGDFGMLMTYGNADFSESGDDRVLVPSASNGHQCFIPPVIDNSCLSALGQIFNIIDVSPAWALSTEATKASVVGFFNDGQSPCVESKLFLACGDSVLPVEEIQAGVFRCLISPQTPGLVNLYLTFDGHTPISQVLTFEFRAPILPSGMISLENKSNWEEFQLQMRLAHLLFSSSKSLSIFSTKLSGNALKTAKAFTQKTSHISDGWVHLTKMIGDTKVSFPQAKDSLFVLILQNRLREWLLEQLVAECKLTERDEQGQGVIHLCALLGYTWAVYPYSCSGLSLDYRDKFGWTALHWAAYYGREKMIATLLSAGAKANLVTDPTSENPGGCTAADLASKNGYDGLSAYLAEKALVAQFNDMALAGNVSGSLQTTNDPVNVANLSEEELHLKDTLAAYRTAADAAARIQSAFREHALKVQVNAVESSNPEMEARNIIAAMKIQHAFRNYETRKQMAAAARIQYRFRTWKMRRNFLNIRRHAIKIQSVFRGFQVRRQYRKIIWSVGIFEKIILRWCRKRRGFCGPQVQPVTTPNDPKQESDVEEDFFRASRKQAEERVERSVVKVQAMFRSKRAQEEYRRMKLEHNKATLEYEGLAHPDFDMG